jgi:hypothetical protein
MLEHIDICSITIHVRKKRRSNAESRYAHYAYALMSFRLSQYYREDDTI